MQHTRLWMPNDTKSPTYNHWLDFKKTRALPSSAINHTTMKWFRAPIDPPLHCGTCWVHEHNAAFNFCLTIQCFQSYFTLHPQLITAGTRTKLAGYKQNKKNQNQTQPLYIDVVLQASCPSFAQLSASKHGGLRWHVMNTNRIAIHRP